MDLQDLSDIHSGRYTQRIQHDIKGTSVRKEWHILNWKYTGNDTLVTMTTSHLITNGDLSLLCNINTYCLIYSRAQLIAVLSCKYLGIYDNTIFTVRYFKGSITYLSCLLTEDGTKETLLSSKLCLSLRSNLTNKDITGTYLSTDTDDTTLIQIFQSIITDTRNITCDLFRSQLGITGFCLIFLDMDRCINIILYQSLAKQNGILVVITFPGHKSDQRVLTKCKLTIGCRRTISDNLSCLNVLTLEHDRSLVVAVALVASHKFGQMIIIFCSVIVLDGDICRCRTKYGTCFSCNNTYTGVNGCLGLHTCTNNRSLCCKKRNGLTLHV